MEQKSFKQFDFVVIGATGEQGQIASRDLLENGHRVLLCGRSPDRLAQLLKHRNAAYAFVDLTDVAATAKLIRRSGSRIVLNCAELTWNLQAMEACHRAQSHYLDLGGLHDMTIKQFQQERAWRKKQRTALLGCGSTPGIANVMAAFAVSALDTVDHIDLGFAWDSNIKEFVLPYSFKSIVYELTMPAIVLENRRFKSVRACTLEGITKFLEVGEQATYCIVHSEVFTFFRYFKKKGLQSVHYKAGFPAHSERVLQTLMELGFAEKKPFRNRRGKTIVPIDFTNGVLKSLPRPKHYRETEDLWVKVYGMKNGKNKNIEMDCVVKPTPGWSQAGSNVDTGRTISIMAQMLKRGEIATPGITAPEAAVPPRLFFQELEKRGMKIYRQRKRLRL